MASASKSSQPDSRAEKSVQAFRDALEKSVTISLERLQEVLDDAVKRGRMTRGDAEDLVGRLVAKSRDQAEEIRRQLEDLIVQLREAGSAAGAAAANPRRTAGRAADRAKREIESAKDRALGDIEDRAKKARKRAVKAADQPLATADRARRRARLPGFPISGYDELSVPQIDRRLADLKPAQLRKVRDHERANKARKGVLRAVDRELKSGS